MSPLLGWWVTPPNPRSPMEPLICMTPKEAQRYDIIQELILKKVTVCEVAGRLSLSTRQVKRLKKQVQAMGIQGVVHRLRGKPSNHILDADVREQALTLLKTTYPDFGPTLATEKLEELHAITVHPTTVRTLMIEAGLWKPRHRKHNQQHREWRPRKELFGEMEQFDGSYHLWFEDRGEEHCLLASIDDATGTITRARFTANEGVQSVFTFWMEYLEQHGKPGSIYLDKYSTYKVNHKNAVDNAELKTQFERACAELDIRLITAHSPQAKGRVERLFQTLQDRLVKELRLRNISDPEAANRFLEEEFLDSFNRKFGVQAKQEGDAHRALMETEKTSMTSIFSVRSKRRVNNDFTVRFKNNWYQLAAIQPTTVLRHDEIVIEEWLDDTIHLKLRGHELSTRVLPERPERVKKAPRVTALTRAPIHRKPAKDHPWKKSNDALFRKHSVAAIIS